MAYDKFLIAPYKSGLKKDMTTWLTPRDSFKNLENVYINKGKIVKRFGGKLVGGSHNTSRVRVFLGKTDAITGILAGTVPGVVFKVGQVFSVGVFLFTVNVLGAPANMLSTDFFGSGTFDTTPVTGGSFVITTTSLDTDVYWYPSEPIMAITHYELGPVNEHVTYVMDTQFIYKFDGTSFILDTTFTGAFTGTNSDFFWSANFVGLNASNIGLFTTNFTQADTMQYYDGTSWSDFSAVTKFNSAQDIVQTAKIIIPWKGRLLLLNIIEKTIIGPAYTAYTNRIRFSHYLDAIDGNAWLEEKMTYGAHKGDGAGYIDIPLQQEITSAVIIKDRLIVYCERSTWELVYTGNPGLPFTWRSINTSIGSESTFSTVNFINEAVTISTSGIFACNGTDVERIDKDIPDEVFELFKSADGTKRIQGVRDTYNHLVYFSILEFSASETHTYPNKLLVFNYYDHSWSFFDDTITAFGYFEQSANINWSNPGIWDTFDTWGSYFQQGNSRFVLAGNHQGFLFTVNSDHPENAEVMSIADITLGTGKAVLTIPNHNLSDGEFIKVYTGNVTYTGSDIFKVNIINADGIYITSNSFAGVYTGGGEVTRVSKISIQSNDWNPYVKEGDNVYLAKMDFCVKNTQDCEMTVDYSLDSLGWSFVREGKNTLSNMGTNVLELHAYDGYDIEVYKEVLWRTVYFQASGDFVNITISMSDSQMLDPDKSLSPFELQGMILYTMRGNK